MNREWKKMNRQYRALPLLVSIVLFGNLAVHGQNATLFAPLANTTTFLMDDNEEIINTWESSYSPGNACYLLDDRSLLRTGSLGPQGNNVFGRTGGAGGVVEHYDWDGDVLWSFEYNSDSHLLHHDIEYLPNGNILMIAWDRKTEAEAIAAGRNPSQLSDGELWPDKIIEVEPNGSSGGTIVWEWHVWDHLIQDYDTSKPNYGTISDEPSKIDLNFVQGPEGADWNHINAVNYNNDLDQILLTVHNFSEIWIIDHATTTEQASGSAGDLLYRWGNPQAYGRGTSSDQQLFVPHDGRWIQGGILGEDDILIFNNGQNRPEGNYSTVDQFTPAMNDNGEYILSTDTAFGPSDLSWTYRASPVTSFFAQNISGAQRLLDGNTLICDGPAGTFFEVTPEGETVWEYVNPFTSTTPQGEINSVFRAVRYDLDNLGGDDPLSLTYPIVDTGQEIYYNNSSQVSAPTAGEAFYGQDADYSQNQPSYTDNSDGTVTDNITGLMWQKSPDRNGDGVIDYDDKLTLNDAIDSTTSFNLAGYDDWRLPTIKEHYSLIMYSGAEPNPNATSQGTAVPYIDTDYFGFGYGDISEERIIDAQYASSTIYVSTTMNGNETMFGVNYADGRIKGYPAAGPQWKKYYVMYVRGNTDYGVNEFEDNGDGTITDNSTGLMWGQNDSGNGALWEDALSYAENSDFGGYTDWRLPNAKELQSLLDYTRSPETSASAAIDPLFNCTQITNEAGEPDYPYYWTGTTFCSQSITDGTNAVYVCFGRALGYMNGSWIDVHGAGAQRSDPKTGSPDDFPFGFGPQGDAIRINNYVRLVRGNSGSITGIDDSKADASVIPNQFNLLQNYPNPFNPSTTIRYELPEDSNVSLIIYDVRGQEIMTLHNEVKASGNYEVVWSGTDRWGNQVSTGVYFCRLEAGSFSQTIKMLYLK